MTETKESNKILQKLIAILMVFVSVFSVFSLTKIDVYAARGASYTVTTKANWSYPGQESITIKQKKQEYYSNSKKTKTKSCYMTYTIVCKPIGNSSAKTIKKTLTGSSIKINLARNTVYSVTITAGYQPNDTKGYGIKSQGYASFPIMLTHSHLQDLPE